MVPAVLLGDLNMLRCFAQSGVPVVVASSDAREPVLRSRHAQRRTLIAPFEDTNRVLEDLELIRDHSDGECHQRDPMDIASPVLP